MNTPHVMTTFVDTSPIADAVIVALSKFVAVRLTVLDSVAQWPGVVANTGPPIHLTMIRGLRTRYYENEVSRMLESSARFVLAVSSC